MRMRSERAGKGRTARATKIKLLAAVALSVAPAVVDAADIQWGVQDGNWLDTSNWVGGALPGATDRAVLDFGTTPATAHVTTNVTDIRSGTVKNGNTLSIEAGGDLTTLVGSEGVLDGLTYTGVINDAAWAFRIGDGSAGTVNVSDGTLIQSFNTPNANLSADIYVGVGAGGTGTLTQGGAASLVRARDFRIGSDTATGTYTLNDGIANSNWFIVGRAGGTGTLNLNGGTINANLTTGSRFMVSDASNSTGTVNMTGGAINATGIAVIGFNNTSHGFMTMDAGTVTSGLGFYVAWNDGGNTANRAEGTMTLNGGTINVGTNFSVGYQASNGVMTMNGGTINVTGTGSVGFDDRATANRLQVATGLLNQHAGSITVGGGFTIATLSGTGTYNLDGTSVLSIGTANTHDLLIGGDNNHPTITTSLGTLTLADTAAVTVAGALRMGQSSGKAVLTMTGGTLTVNGASSIIGQSGAAGKLGTGSLTLNGATALASFAGTVSLANASNTTGSITVTNGTLIVTGNSQVGGGGTGNGNLTVDGGAATFSGNLTAGDSTNSTGVINVSSGSLNVGGALVAGRNTTVSGVITLSGTGIINAGSIGVRTNTGSVAATDFNVTGGTLNVTGDVTNNSTFDYSGGIATIGGSILGNGTTSVAAGLTLAANSVTQTAVNLSGTLQAKPGAGISKITTFNIPAGGKFDMTNTKLIVPGNQYSTVVGLVQAGRNTGQWDGTGIMTSLTDADAPSIARTLAVAKASDIKSLGAGQTALWEGAVVADTDTLVRYTWGGDANLSGNIDADDYFRIDSQYNKSGTVFGYYNGDFNDDGLINGDDFSIIDANYSAQMAAPVAGVTAVPEPASLSLLGLAGAALLKRRRRN